MSSVFKNVMAIIPDAFSLLGDYAREPLKQLEVNRQLKLQRGLMDIEIDREVRLTYIYEARQLVNEACQDRHIARFHSVLTGLTKYLDEIQEIYLDFDQKIFEMDISYGQKIIKLIQSLELDLEAKRTKCKIELKELRTEYIQTDDEKIKDKIIKLSDIIEGQLIEYTHSNIIQPIRNHLLDRAKSITTSTQKTIEHQRIQIGSIELVSQHIIREFTQPVIDMKKIG